MKHFINSRRLPGVTAVEVSQNAKLGACSATYVAKVSCPEACAFYSTCYASYGHTGIIWRRLGEQAKGLSPLELAENEAELIEQMSGSFPLRLHVVGDSTTRPGTRKLARASEKFTRRKGQSVWTYTHAAGVVKREDWGEVSVLASCESIEGVRKAAKRGYASALVVSEFERNAAYDIGHGYRLVPCPAQTTDATCSSCRLCWDSERLRERQLVIGFAAHGSGARAVRMALPVVEAR